uniref:major histocompatibility complex class I-related gene protein-like n=1 Tax=Semicossyphus pulcher TaxID=241346 RepID=UPI0037E81046
MVAAAVDDIVVANCDSNKKMIEVKRDWMEKLFENDPQHMERYTFECLENQRNDFKAKIYGLKQRFNQSGDVHILQRMSGCEWDDETGEVKGFNQFGYNGEDFIAFDLKTLSWIAPRPQAFITKLRWDADRAELKYIEHYYTQVFPDWLKTYVAYGKSSLLRTDLPSVSLLQKTSSSPVSCHATGFYPNSAVMFWRKDGVELYEDVNHGEILPNHDGSFQMSVDLTPIPSESSADWGKYECVFQLSGVKEDIVTKLDKDAIRTNSGKVEGLSYTTNPATVVIAVVVVAVVVAVVAGVGFTFYKKRKVSRPRPSSENSNTQRQSEPLNEEETPSTNPPEQDTVNVMESFLT